MPLCLVFLFIKIKGLVFLFYSRLKINVTFTRSYRGSDDILVHVWLLLQSVQLSCIVWYWVIKTVGLSQHTSWIKKKKKALWNNRNAPCPFLFSSTRSIFSRVDITNGPAEVRGHRPKAEGSKTELIFITQMPAASDWEKKNLRQLTSCPGRDVWAT